MLINWLDYMKKHSMSKWKFHHMLLFVLICVVGFGGAFVSLLLPGFIIKFKLEWKFLAYSLIAAVLGITSFFYVESRESE